MVLVFASALKLAFMDLAFISVTIGVFDQALTGLLIIKEVSLIDRIVCIFIDSSSVLFIVLQFPFVTVTVL
jgi:hypothetical protein